MGDFSQFQRRLSSVWLVPVDGFGGINKKYNAIFFAATLATDEAESSNVNRYDHNGRLLKSVLRALPTHLNPEGRLFKYFRMGLENRKHPYFPYRRIK